MAKDGVTIAAPAVQRTILKLMEECFKQESPIRSSLRTRFERIDRAYARENDLTEETKKAEIRKAKGDVTAFRNNEMPVVLPKVESAVVYQASVFLQSPEVFAVVSPPEGVEAAEQISAIMENQAERGSWVAELTKFFRSGAKYNLAALEVDWVTQASPVIKSDARETGGAKVELANWEGNAITALDIYNTYFDTRVPPSKVAAEGEFAGYVSRVSRVRLISIFKELGTDFITQNKEAALKSQTRTQTYWVPSINTDFNTDYDSVSGNIDWEVVIGVAKREAGTASAAFDFSDSYEVNTAYIRIIPNDLGMAGAGAPNTPQIWKFVTVNNEVLICAKRLTNKHNFLPIIIGQAMEDNLSFQTKSLAENVIPLQDTISAMFNSTIAARRRAVNDRALYNPRLIDPRHLRDDSPTAKIPLRPAASIDGGIQNAYYPIPFNDASQINLSEIGIVQNFANSVTGQNPAREGQFVKGNKTRSEYQDVLTNSNGRDQLTAMHYESRVFSVVKRILLSNILQFQSKSVLISPSKKKSIEVDPDTLREQTINFKVSDGLSPAEKLMDAESLAVAFQTLQAVPQIAQEYNVGSLFAYLMNIKGADIEDFKKSQNQIMYEQAIAQWQSAAMQYAKMGQEFKAPMPTPQQFGINPQQDQQAQQEE